MAKRRFNITGLCFPEDNFMADISRKLDATLEMIEQGEYFVINRPRQYGKTTTLHTLENILQKTDEYLPLNISFEGIGDLIFDDERMFTSGFIELLAQQAGLNAPELEQPFLDAAKEIDTMKKLSNAITFLLKKTDKKVVVMIDEVDKSSNNQLFVSFLAMLRYKFLDRKKIKTFHSVILAGLHDVKSLKLKLRPDEEQKYNSPWNIAAEFKVDMNLQPFEIKPMLDDYVAERGVKMDTAAMSEDLFYYTSGYPFLVSKLCKILDEDILPTKDEKEWTEADLEWAIKKLVLEKSTNSESLIKNLENNPDLYRIAYRILIDGKFKDYNTHDPIIDLGIMYGIFKNDNGIRIHNKIYEELIYHYMTSKTDTEIGGIGYPLSKNFELANKTLNMVLVLEKFQAFMREQYSKQDRDFLERHGRLVYLAFLKPILNGHGYDFKETQISEERRLDVVITFYQHKYVAELKIWRGEAAHAEGLDQLSDYLDRLKLTEGYLLIFDHSAVKTWDSGWITHKDKKIFIVWV
jgi:energy-coupling factor transporter ATP-binding protein EcfA2